jgi:3-oxoacyl-[acyl-carrier protein] reductase
VDAGTRVALVEGAATPVGSAIAQRLDAAGFDMTSGSGPLDVAVYADHAEESLTWQPFADVDERTFARWCEQPLRDFLQWLQAVYPRIASRQGVVVLVAGIASQEGATGLVPYTTAVEGQRLLAKSAARQWASDGVTVLIVAPRVDALAGDRAAASASDAGRTAPVLGPASHGPAAVAGVVSMLVGSTGAPARVLTGSTFLVDGGALMAP